MMAHISLRTLFVHWLAFLEALQHFFWNYLPQPLLSTVFPELIEGNPKFPPIVHVPPFRHPPDYSNFVDLATTCPAPTLFPIPLAMNLSHSVDGSDYDLDGACSAESSHYYVFLDIPVWRPVALHKDKPPTTLSAEVGDDHAQTNMAPYGPRGLSFCPVLVGIVYVQSLLHLYMLLMIPSLFNHWFEDVLVYESLNPTELLDCSWLPHTSLWMAPWFILRYGIRKVVPCLYRHFRRVSYKSAHPPIPRIVLIRVDGEAVPVNFIEDHPQASNGVDVSPSLESTSLGMHNSWSVTSDSGGSRPLMQPVVSDSGKCIAVEFDTLPKRAVSHQGETAEAQGCIALGSLTSESAKTSQFFVKQIPDEQLEVSPDVVNAADESLQSVDKNTFILAPPGLDILVTTPSDHSIDERPNKFDQVAFPEAGADDDCQDGTDSLGRRASSDKDVTFCRLVDHYGPDESKPPSETVSATSSPVVLQDAPVRNVRFAIGDDANGADAWQVSHADQYTCARDLGSQLGDDNITPVHIPVVPFDPSMDEQDGISLEQVIGPVLPVVLSEEQVEDSDVVLAESLSSCLTGKPIVKLPTLVATREDVQFVEMVSVVPGVLIEDVATRSPLQMLSPMVTPAVVINMNCISSTPLGTEKLGQGWPPAEHAFDWVGTLNDKAAICETSDTVSPCEDRSCLPSPSVEGSSLICSPVVDSMLPLRDVRTLESEVGMPVVSTSLVVTNTSPRAATQIPGTNELLVEAEVLYETPRYNSDGNDLAKSLRNDLQGPDASVLGATRMHLPAVSELPGESIVEHQVDFVVAEKFDNTITTLTSQPVGLSGTLATESPTIKSFERRLLALSDTSEDVTSLSMLPAEEKASEYGKCREDDTISWDHGSTGSKPAPERTLSGSMHAPSESLRISRTKSHIHQTSVVYETPPLMDHGVSLVRPDEAKESMSTITENISKRKQDLSASIHAPQRISKPGVQSSVSQSRDEINRDHRRSVTNPVVVPERKPITKPCPPNWTAMPEVVDAFRMFKQAASENTIRRVSSFAECTNRGPMLGVVGQKGTTTSSLNNASATANIQSHWMHGSGLLLVRDPVSSDPADFNLRTCTNTRTSKIRGMNAIPVQQVLCPGMFDIHPYALQHGITPCTIRVKADFSSMVAGSTEIQRQQSILVPHNAEIGPTFGSQRWMDYRG